MLHMCIYVFIPYTYIHVHTPFGNVLIPMPQSPLIRRFYFDQW